MLQDWTYLLNQGHAQDLNQEAMAGAGCARGNHLFCLAPLLLFLLYGLLCVQHRIHYMKSASLSECMMFVTNGETT